MIKKISLTIITIITQIIVGHLLAFFGTFAVGIGNGWELVVWPFWNTLGVWGVGLIINKQRKFFKKEQYILTLLGTALGSATGVIVMVIYVSFIFFPLIGALIGYYFSIQKIFISKK